MSFALPDIESDYGYNVRHTMLASAQIKPQNRAFNKTPVLLGPNVIDPNNPPIKKKDEKVYKPCERLLIKLKKEQAKAHMSGSNP